VEKCSNWHIPDVVLFVVDGSAEGRGRRYIVDLLSRTKTQVVLGLNSTDHQKNPDFQHVGTSYTQLAPTSVADAEILGSSQEMD